VCATVTAVTAVTAPVILATGIVKGVALITLSLILVYQFGYAVATLIRQIRVIANTQALSLALAITLVSFVQYAPAIRSAQFAPAYLITKHGV
jgi:hypothetical protein